MKQEPTDEPPPTDRSQGMHCDARTSSSTEVVKVAIAGDFHSSLWTQQSRYLSYKLYLVFYYDINNVKESLLILLTVYGAYVLTHFCEICCRFLIGYPNFFGKFTAAKIRRRIRLADFFRLIFGGQNLAANSDIRGRLGGLVQKPVDCHCQLEKHPVGDVESVKFVMQYLTGRGQTSKCRWRRAQQRSTHAVTCLLLFLVHQQEQCCIIYHFNPSRLQVCSNRISCQLSWILIIFLPARCYARAGISRHRVSVCLSHAGIVSKRLNIVSHKQHHVIAQGL